MTKEEKKEQMKKISKALTSAYIYGIDDEIYRLECDYEYLLKIKTEETK